MTIAARRVDDLWYLLALDFVRPFLEELWFPLADRQVLDYMRRQIEPADLPTYGSDPDARIYRRLTSFSHEYGLERLTSLLRWGNEVLIVDGSDRVAEGWWFSAVFGLSQLGVVNEVGDGARLVLDALRSDLNTARSRILQGLSAVKQGMISDRDRKLMRQQNPESMENELRSMSAMVANTVTCNLLAVSWAKHGSELELQELLQLRRVAEAKAAGFGGAPDGGVPLPGVWQPMLSDWLARRV